MSSKNSASGVPTDAPPKHDNFPTFRRWLPRLRSNFQRFWMRLTCLPFVSRAWWKRNYRRFACFCLVLIAAWIATDIYATTLLNRELSKIRERGEPLTLAELAPPPVPDAQNAAILYRRATDLLRKLNFTGEEQSLTMGIDPKTNQPIPIGQLSPIRRRLLQKYRPAIELIRQASRMPQCRFSTQWKEPAYGILFPHLAQLRKFSRLIRGNAVQEAYDGNTEQAISDAGVIYRISAHAASDPIIIGVLVSTAIEAMGNNALERIFEYSKLTAAQRNSIEAILPRYDKAAQLVRSLQGERVFGLSSFPGIYTPQVQTYVGSDDENNNIPFIFNLLGKSRIARFLWIPMSKFDRVWYIRSFPLNGTSVSKQDFATKNVPSYMYATWLLVPVFDRIQENIDRALASRGLAQIALDLNVYHTQNKTYPATLAQLETQNKSRFPLDNFSGKPFVYRRTKGGYQLYSVGLNKQDDGGYTQWDMLPMGWKSQKKLPDGTRVDNRQWDDITWPLRKPQVN